MLVRLHKHHGPQEFGKICQKFIALAFREAGFPHVVERGVQGVDVDAANGSAERYSIEHKTTIKDSIEFKRKDVDGLMSRCQDGYLPLLGVLRLGLLSDWWLAKVDQLKPGRLCVERLRSYRRKDLEIAIRPFLDAIIDQHFEATLYRSQAYLDEVLRGMGVEIVSQ
jgi:hypothetical protein